MKPPHKAHVDLQALDQIVARFERAWQAGSRPRHEDFLEGSAANRRALVLELVHADLHHRLRINPKTAVEDYLARFPELENDPMEFVALIVAEYKLRSELGHQPAVEDYLRRFPPHRAALINRLGDPECFTSPYQREQSSGDAPELPSQIGRYRIEKILGEGGFGRVYLARDDQLGRPVAIKVPRLHEHSRPEDAGAFLAEARVVASLDHPHIVPVHDVGTTDDGLCYVVSKWIEGIDLAQKIRTTRFTHTQAAELAATVAEALHFAHGKGIVHRDIKPGNILLDAGGKVYVADFGLALKEDDFGKGPGFAGTPAYMSPEQARGEGHRVDGRADIFSLGVVFYEMLTGRRPFKAETRSMLLEHIALGDVRPLRQVDDTIPKELERICFKALAKRASERYMTAKDMAEDLRHFLAQQTGKAQARAMPVTAFHPTTVPLGTHPNLTPPATAMAITPVNPTSDRQPVKIVPKGLRSFDAHDADFFLELLPGPRDRDGLPDSIRFWKTRIEEMDADNTFSVGLIYGPSGCGKSSLVKAGLLPLLSDDVIAVYVEATSGETETRLLNGLRKRCPALPGNLSLQETLAALRRGQGLPVGKKVLIVLDQFEQWLHAKKEEQDTELVQALRQCDGGRVQCVVMVRDDFWLAVSRLMRELEIRLVEGQNSDLVDLFDLDHAQKVLAAFGRAFGKLPENGGETTKEQKEFLTQAVSGLAQEGKVISVRLALFAEMMKGNAWTPATLRSVGGTAGVGGTFLEETFSAGTAPPEHRYHQKAARGVLKALLPESGTDIKGHMRSHGDLLEASGYGSRPQEFDDLMRILDSEIRLITPTDPEGKDEGGRRKDEEKTDQASSDSSFFLHPSSFRYYQLTHDYLVHSLRAWLTRKQKETRRGRAELLLADRASVWNARPENRQLPSLWQWVSIQWWSKKKSWTPPQRIMMRKAGRYHAVRGTVFGLVLAIATVAGLMIRDQVVDQRKATHAAGLVRRVLDAETAQVPAIVGEMAEYRLWLDPLLALENEKATSQSRQKLHASLALLPVDATQVEFLYGRLLEAAPNEVPVIRDALAPHKGALIYKLWAALEKPEEGQEFQRLRAAAALAIYDPENPRWLKVQDAVGNDLVKVPAVYLAGWMESLRPVREKLLVPLSDVYRNPSRRDVERSLAADILADYAADQPKILADLVMDADAMQFAVIFTKLKERGEQGSPVLIGEIDRRLPPDAKDEAKEKLAKRQANAAVALLKMNQPEKVWPVLKHSPDPRVRSYLIHRLGPLGADAKAINKRLDEEQDVTIRRALILSLGEYGEGQLPSSERTVLIARLFSIYEHDPDAGLHGAAEWLLRQWGQGTNLKALDNKLRTNEKQLITALKAPPTEEQKQRSLKLITEIEAIQNQLAECKKTLSARQVAWEQKLRDKPLDFPASLQEGLLAHFPLDEAEGTETANAVKDQPGAAFRGTGKPEWEPGVMGLALRLDGKGDFAGGSPFGLESGKAFSYGCWFQTDGKPGMILISNRGNCSIILGKRGKWRS